MFSSLKSLADYNAKFLVGEMTSNSLIDLTIINKKYLSNSNLSISTAFEFNQKLVLNNESSEWENIKNGQFLEIKSKKVSISYRNVFRLFHVNLCYFT